MSVKTLLAIILGGILANNYALEKLLGVTPFLGWARREEKAGRMGLAVAAVMLLCAAVAWPVQTFVLDALSLGYLQILVYTLIILALVYCADAIAKKTSGKTLGIYFPVIALNSAVLGLCVTNAGAGLSYPEALAAALGAGLGFALGLAVFTALLRKVQNSGVPRAFWGLPITLLAASICSMLLAAFK